MSNFYNLSKIVKEGYVGELVPYSVDFRNVEPNYFKKVVNIFHNKFDNPKEQQLAQITGFKIKFNQSCFDLNNLFIQFNMNKKLVPLGYVEGLKSSYKGVLGEIFVDENSDELSKVEELLYNAYQNKNNQKDVITGRSLTRNKKVYIFPDGSITGENNLNKALGVNSALTVFHWMQKMLLMFAPDVHNKKAKNQFLYLIANITGKKVTSEQELEDNHFVDEKMQSLLDTLSEKGNWYCKKEDLVYRKGNRNFILSVAKSDYDNKRDREIKKIVRDRFNSFVKKDCDLADEAPEFTKDFNRLFSKVKIDMAKKEAPATTDLLAEGIIFCSHIGGSHSDYLSYCLKDALKNKIIIVEGIDDLIRYINGQIAKKAIDPNREWNLVEELKTKAKTEF